MYNHAPDNYNCPFCLLIEGVKNEHVHSIGSDIVYHDAVVTAFIGSHQWPNNPGNVIVVPNEHFENIYDLPVRFAQDIHRVAKRLAIAMKSVYSCDGVSTRQHNEPAGSQDVWHYHLHVTPRYENDNYYGTQRQFMASTVRGGPRQLLSTWRCLFHHVPGIRNSMLPAAHTCGREHFIS